MGPAGFVAVGGQRDGKPMSWTTADGSSWLAGGPEAPRGALRAVIEHDGAYLAAGIGRLARCSRRVFAGRLAVDRRTRLVAARAHPWGRRTLGDRRWARSDRPPGQRRRGVPLDRRLELAGSVGAALWGRSDTGDGPGFVAGGLSALWSSPSDVVGLPESQASIEADADWVPIGMMPRLTPGFTAASGAGRATYFFSETEPKGALQVDKFDP